MWDVFDWQELKASLALDVQCTSVQNRLQSIIGAESAVALSITLYVVSPDQRCRCRRLELELELSFIMHKVATTHKRTKRDSEEPPRVDLDLH